MGGPAGGILDVIEAKYREHASWRELFDPAPEAVDLVDHDLDEPAHPRRAATVRPNSDGRLEQREFASLPSKLCARAHSLRWRMIVHGKRRARGLRAGSNSRDRRGAETELLQARIEGIACDPEPGRSLRDVPPSLLQGGQQILAHRLLRTDDAP